MKQTPGKMYLSDQRGTMETAQFRRFCTFNFGMYSHEHKQPFGRLWVLNEEILAGGQRMNLTVEQPSHIILLPITGAVTLSDEQGRVNSVDVGELLIHSLPGKQSFQLTNPYPNDWIHFLQLWVKAEQPMEAAATQLFPYNFQAMENRLTEIMAESETPADLSFPFSVNLGRFAGRQEDTYSLKSSRSGFFAFVIAGAFEVEGRLLHEKDGLALWDTAQVELEALNEQAILLVLELTQ